MGSLGTHAEIGSHVVRQVSLIRPDEDYSYLRLGNFLSDLSQFRDPFAYMLAKRKVIAAAPAASWATRNIPIVAGLAWIPGVFPTSWMNELLGKAQPPTKRHGALAQFLTQVCRFATHHVFASDSPVRSSNEGKIALWKLFGTNVPPIEPDEIERVFGAATNNPKDLGAFTQYFPHEHLDFPPLRVGASHRRDPLFQRQPSGLIGYLEMLQIRYISEELSQIELSWLKSKNRPASHQHRRDLLVRLGHVLHTIEDFYFHSNFVELYYWAQLRSAYPSLDVADANDSEWLLLHSLDATRHGALNPNDPVSVQLFRRMARRLRYPIYAASGPLRIRAPYQVEPSQRASEDATSLLYTGGFGSLDISHTMAGGMERLEELIDYYVIANPSHDPRNSKLVLLQAIFNEAIRHRLAEDSEFQEERVWQHKRQLNRENRPEGRNEYETRIQALLGAGELSKTGAAALQEAFRIDAALQKKYKDFPGVGGFLIKFVAKAQQEVERSARRTEMLNRQGAKSIIDKATVNCRGELCASEETIGTHSLLSKDDATKEPFRDEARYLASHASAAVAVILANRVNTDSDASHGIDWDRVVRHYLRFPKVGPNSWETYVLTALANRSAIPDFAAVPDSPTVTMLSPKYGPEAVEKLNRRRIGTRKELEALYTRLEAQVDR